MTYNLDILLGSLMNCRIIVTKINIEINLIVKNIYSLNVLYNDKTILVENNKLYTH